MLYKNCKYLPYYLFEEIIETQTKKNIKHKPQTKIS